MDNHKVYLRICEELAELSKCVKHKVGTVIVKNNKIISTGVNGTVPGFCNCSDHFQKHDHSSELFKSEHRRWSALYEVHSEINALLRAGTDSYGATLYCNLEPCFDCLKAMLAAGIKEIYYAKKHKHNLDGEEAQQFIFGQGVKIKHIYLR